MKQRKEGLPFVVSDAGAMLRAISVTLTAAQLAALHAAPLVLVDEAGVGPNVAAFPVMSTAVFRLGALTSLTLAAPIVAFAGEVALLDVFDAADPITADVGYSAAPATGALALADIAGAFTLQTTDPIPLPGEIAEATIGAPGTGYAKDDTFACGTAEGVVDSVGAGGAVESFHFTNRGSDMLIGDAQATTSANGTGFKLDVSAVNPADNTTQLDLEIIIRPRML